MYIYIYIYIYSPSDGDCGMDFTKNVKETLIDTLSLSNKEVCIFALK